jgi:hypothetical protein
MKARKEKKCVVGIRLAAKKIVTDKVEEMEARGEFANETMLVTNAIYAAYGKPQGQEAV